MSGAKLSEAQIHRATAKYLQAALRPPTCWTTIGHGGGGKVRGAQLKGLGMAPGWPDILVIGTQTDGKLHCVGIEMKSATGSLSPEQKEVRDMFQRCGCGYAVARRPEDAEVILRQNDIPVFATLIGLPTAKIERAG